MSFIKRAQEAAEAAKQMASDAAATATRTAKDPTTQEKINKSFSTASQGAREAAGMARRGVTTVIEKIDPSTLAELVIKATALQEMTNTSLREKRSPYRISEISISASIPPGVSFAISRIDSAEEVIDGTVRDSAQLVQAAADSGDVVLALDGATIDESTVKAYAEAAAVPEGTMAPSSIAHGPKE